MPFGMILARFLKWRNMGEGVAMQVATSHVDVNHPVERQAKFGFSTSDCFERMFIELHIAARHSNFGESEGHERR